MTDARPHFDTLTAEQVDARGESMLSAEAEEEHVFTAVVVLRYTKEEMLSPKLLMDSKHVAMVKRGCFICEQEWTPELADTRCPGDSRSAAITEIDVEEVRQVLDQVMRGELKATAFKRDNPEGNE